MTWVLSSATTRVGESPSDKDICTIVYSETTQDEEGNDVVETRTAKHQRSNGYEIDGDGHIATHLIDNSGIEFEEGDDAELFHTAPVKQGLQTDEEWHRNIEGEIVADLSGLNKTELAEVDITARVR